MKMIIRILDIYFISIILLILVISINGNKPTKETPKINVKNSLKNSNLLIMTCTLKKIDTKIGFHLYHPLGNFRYCEKAFLPKFKEIDLKGTFKCVLKGYNSVSGYYSVEYTIDRTNPLLLGKYHCMYLGKYSPIFTIKPDEKTINNTNCKLSETKSITNTTISITTKKPINNGGKSNDDPTIRKSTETKENDPRHVVVSAGINPILTNPQFLFIILGICAISLFLNVFFGCRCVFRRCHTKKFNRDNHGSGGGLSRFLQGIPNGSDDDDKSSMATTRLNHTSMRRPDNPPPLPGPNPFYITHPNTLQFRQMTPEQNTVYDETSLVGGIPVGSNGPINPHMPTNFNILSRIQNSNGHYVAPSTLCPSTPAPGNPNIQQRSFIQHPPSPSDMQNNEVYVPMGIALNGTSIPLTTTENSYGNTTPASNHSSNNYTHFIPYPTFYPSPPPQMQQPPTSQPQFIYACNSINHLPQSASLTYLNGHHNINNLANRNNSLQSLTSTQPIPIPPSSSNHNGGLIRSSNENGAPIQQSTNENCKTNIRPSNQNGAPIRSSNENGAPIQQPANENEALLKTNDEYLKPQKSSNNS